MNQSPSRTSPTLRLGIIASTLAAIAAGSVLFFYPAASSEATLSSSEKDKGIFNEIYEPSAVFQLNDGRVLLVEDEQHRAMNILTISANGSLVENKAANLRLTEGFERKLEDLEGLTADHEGFIYVTSSHSLRKNGDRDPNREQLVRFRVKGDDVSDIASITTLRDDLINSKEISATIKEQTGKAPDFKELNIEGLTYYHKTDDLMLGLRAPMAGKLAIIVPITNPNAVFDDEAAAVFGKPMLIDLDGGGIRSLHFSTALNKYVIANEVQNEKGKDYSKIWTWSGNPTEAPIAIDLPELSDMKNIEGIDSVKVNGVAKLLFTADEGNEKKSIPAKYRFVDEAKFK